MSEKIVEIEEDTLLWIDERYNRLRAENKRLHSIIKEVREILESKKHCERLFGGVEGKSFIEQALELLNKGE